MCPAYALEEICHSQETRSHWQELVDVKKESPPVAMGCVTQPLRPHLVLSEESHMSALQDRQEEEDTEGDR